MPARPLKLRAVFGTMGAIPIPLAWSRSHLLLDFLLRPPKASPVSPLPKSSKVDGSGTVEDVGGAKVNDV